MYIPSFGDVCIFEEHGKMFKGVVVGGPFDIRNELFYVLLNIQNNQRCCIYENCIYNADPNIE